VRLQCCRAKDTRAACLCSCPAAQGSGAPKPADRTSALASLGAMLCSLTTSSAWPVHPQGHPLTALHRRQRRRHAPGDAALPELWQRCSQMSRAEQTYAALACYHCGAGLPHCLASVHGWALHMRGNMRSRGTTRLQPAGAPTPDSAAGSRAPAPGGGYRRSRTRRPRGRCPLAYAEDTCTNAPQRRMRPARSSTWRVPCARAGSAPRPSPNPNLTLYPAGLAAPHLRREPQPRATGPLQRRRQPAALGTTTAPTP